MSLQMLPRHEMDITITWDEEPSTGEKLLSSFSPPLKYILDKPLCAEKADTYIGNIGEAIKLALEREYPNIVCANLTITCRVSVRKPRDSQGRWR